MAVYDINRIMVPEVPPDYEDHTADVHFVPAPCQVACPVGTDAPSYLAYIWEDKFEEAFEAITATNPFSSICGRVCDAPCEPACRRADSDGPVQIKNLKRYVMDELGATYRPQPAEVTREESIAIVGAGPAGLVAAHDLCIAGFRVHVYEMTDRLGGMMIWGIPAFRLPQGIIEEDIERLHQRCPSMEVHLNTALGRDISLDELKQRHHAVLLTIGSWWGKPMGIPGEDDVRVVDGVGFLRRVNAGERPELPETVVVIGGGDVAMDACRVAKRLPGCQHVKVVYRRGAVEIPARSIELEGAIKEGIEFVYNTQQIAVESRGNELVLSCVRTAPGEPDADGRRRPVVEAGSEHEIACGMVIAAVGQQSECDELDRQGLMDIDRVRTRFESMRTDDPKVFAAGDGAFGGSTIVMAMHHGQRAAYYIKAFLEGVEDPIAYRTPYRTRRVPVAQDLLWELLPVQEPEFFGVGDNPVNFPEIESTYDRDAARQEAARCFRCDAETGSADYAVTHREDIFSMARTNPLDTAKHRAMLARRLRTRANPFPEFRHANLDDLVFLPANLSRLVIDPYREACRISTDIAGQLELEHPFLVAGFDESPAEVREPLAEALVTSHCGYLGRRALGLDVSWFQRLDTGDHADERAAAVVVSSESHMKLPKPQRARDNQLAGLAITAATANEASIGAAISAGFDFLLLDGSGNVDRAWAELSGAPDLTVVRETIASLRAMGQEEHIDLIYFGGIRSGTDAAKIISFGVKAVVIGVPAGLAAGGRIEHEQLMFSSDYTADDRAQGVVNFVKACGGEASMMARCTGKTRLHNLEPEDLRAITLATAEATGIPLAGARPG